MKINKTAAIALTAAVLIVGAAAVITRPYWSVMGLAVQTVTAPKGGSAASGGETAPDKAQEEVQNAESTMGAELAALLGEASSEPEAQAESSNAGSEETAQSEAGETGSSSSSAASESEPAASSAASSSGASSSHEAQSDSASQSASSAQSVSSASSRAASSAQSASSGSSGSFETQLRALNTRYKNLESKFESRLKGIIRSALNEYMALPKEQRGLAKKISICLSKINALRALESECDAEVNALTGEVRTLLQNNGKSTALADEMQRNYKAKKNALYSDLLKQMYSGGDGSGSAGQWLKEH